MFFGRFMEFALILSLWPFVIGPSFVNNSWKNRITTMINQCSLTRFQTAPPLFLDQTEARRAEKNFFETAPPLSQGLDDRPPPYLDRHCRLSWWNNLSSSVFWKRDVGFYFCFFFFFREACSHNLRARIRGLFFGFLGILLPFVLLVNFLASSSAKGTLDNFVGKNISEKLHVYTVRAILFSTRQC